MNPGQKKPFPVRFYSSADYQDVHTEKDVKKIQVKA